MCPPVVSHAPHPLGHQRRLLAQHHPFFFQAEDGIRDYKVTGVQTCALPIYLETEVPRLTDYLKSANAVAYNPVNYFDAWSLSKDGFKSQDNADVKAVYGLPATGQIGRASCRERV